MLNSFARCSARLREREAEEVLRLPFGAPEQHRAVRRLAADDCLRVDAQLRFNARLMVGGMAEHFLAQRYASVDGAIVRALSDEQIDTSPLRPRNDLEDLALCIVRRDPDAALTLIRAAPTSPGEQSAVQSLTPHLGPCVPAGMTINFGVPMLRSMIGTALFRTLQHIAPQAQR